MLLYKNNFPENWKFKVLKDVGKIIMGQSPPSSTYNENGDGLPFLQGKMEFEDIYPSPTIYCSNPIKIAEKNDVLISVRAPVGEVNISPTKICIGRGLAAIRCNPDKVNYLFLFYYLKHKVKKFESISAGSTFKAIRKDDLAKFPILLPPLAEQRKIAEILSTVDSAIHKVSDAIAKTERLKKGLRQELLTKGIINGFMFDTNIFDAILDGKISVDQLPTKYNYYITHIQKDEIENIQKPEKLERKKKLLEIFKKLDKKAMPTETTVLDVSRWDNSKFGEGDLYDKILSKLQELDEKTGKRKTRKNQIRDALIAETSIKNNLILVSNDKNLRSVTAEFGGQAIAFEQFLEGEYRKFKDSEIGRIPEEWEVVRLENGLELCQYGLSIPLGENGKYPIIRMDEIVNGRVISEISKYVDIDEETFKNFKLEKEDILFNRTNSYELVGRTGIFLLDGNYVFASYLIRLRPKRKVFDPQFLTFYLIFSNEKLRQLATRAVHQANINATNLKKFKVPLPPLPEQRKIAEIISTVDKKLELEKKRKGKLERIKKGLMNDLLTGKRRVKVEV